MSQDEDKPVKMADKPMADTSAEEKGQVSDVFAENLAWSQQLGELKTSLRCTFACLGVATMAILVGYDMMLIGSIIANNEFVENFGVYHEALGEWSLPADRQLAWTICQYLSAILGAVLVGLMSDRLGRRIAVYSTVSLTFIGTVVELVSPNWKVWCVAKILMGMAMGFMQGNTQTYVSELAHVRIRGFMLALFQFWIIVGCFLAACVLQGTSQIDGPWSWKAAVISQLGVGAVCLLVYVLSTPESPYYFAGRNNTEGARASLLKLHGGRPGYNVDEELGAIMAAIEHERAMASGAESGTYVECFRSTNLRRTLLACLPMAMQQFGGYTLCNNYLAYFLRQSGLGDPFLITVVANCLSIVAVMACFALVEKVGRRPQILWGYAAMIPCLLAITILGWVGVGTAANDSALSAFSIIWNVFYFMSVGSIGWTMAGEMSSMRLRAKTTSLATIANAVFNLGWAIATPYLINADEANLGPKAGIVFLGPSIILAVVAYFVVPETKGTSFAQLDRLFESRTPARKFHP